MKVKVCEPTERSAARVTRSTVVTIADDEVELTDDERAKLKEEAEKKEIEKKGVALQAFQELLKIRNKGKSKRGDIKAIVKKYNALGYGYITRGSMNYSVLLHSQKKKPLSSVLIETVDTGLSSLTNAGVAPVVVPGPSQEPVKVYDKGGRKKGSTVAAKCLHAATVNEALSTASYLCFVEYIKAQSEHKSVVPGTYKRIIRDVEEEHKLETDSINIETVKSRIKRRNTTGYSAQRTSPLIDIEPLIVQYCQRLANMGVPLTREQVIGLADDAIKGNVHYDKMLSFKQNLHLKVPEHEDDGSLIGIRWYYGFLERNKDKIRRGKGKVKDIKRHTWCTYAHFEEMYDCIYDRMVHAKVAVKLDDYVCYDKNGDEINEENPGTVFGRPTKYKITNPERILFVDECGSNTNQKSDGQVGGQKFVFPCGGDNTGTLGSNTDLHFTVLCFNNALGTPVLCAVILKSKKEVSEVPLSWQFGIDITKNVHGDINGNNIDFFLQNSNKGCAMQGGPDCFYNGNTVPCFVGTSPNASITSVLLAEMLKHMDKFAIFDRSEGRCPFLLLDGHQSRFNVPFLDYVHHPNNKWVVCLGVPYGTHIWQVADSSQLNGNFKIWLTKSKKLFFDIKRDLNKNFEPADIIPLINSSFQQSYGNELGARKAMLERGWGPLNYALLEHEQLKKTRIIEESNILHHQFGEPANTIDLSTINMREGSLMASATDLLLQERSKQQGYHEKVKRRKLEIDLKKTSLEKLTAIGRLTSGTMAAGGMYYLCSNVRDIIKTNTEKKQNERKQIVRRSIDRNNKMVKEYNKIRNKIELDEQVLLTGIEMKVVLVQHRRKSDSPLKSKVGDLREQYAKRHHRILREPSPKLMIVDDDDKSSNEDVDVDDLESVGIGTECDVGESMEL